MGRHKREQIIKYFAIFAIYLIISLTFFTAGAFARLEYSISGEDGISGFAKRDYDNIKIEVNASSDVSFESGTIGIIPITGCENTSDGISCTEYIDATDIDTSITEIPFTLVQSEGYPASLDGALYIDDTAPTGDYTTTKDGTNLIFDYEFTDHLSSITDNDCRGSGIGYIDIRFQGKSVNTQRIYTNNCTVAGSYTLELSGTFTDKVTHNMVVRDRLDNELSTALKNESGDFRAPLIQGAFSISRSGNNITEFSSNANNIIADIVVEIEDANLTEVYGDLSQLHSNPAINIPYQNAIATCIPDSGNLNICTFSGIQIKPTSNTIDITITAIDGDRNNATKTISKTIILRDNAGQALFVGTSKEQCTSDLGNCYTKPGPQQLYAELDATSNYDKTLIYLGVNSERTFAVCRLEGVWKCNSGTVYINSDSNVFLAESYDNYGNELNSNLERTIYVDYNPPRNISGLSIVNSNNNYNCSVSGDELEFKINITEETPELKIYANTTGFTSLLIQRGTCEILGNGNYECTLTIKEFSSSVSSNDRYIFIEDLAGHKLPIPYKFEVCKSTSDKTPNLISKVTQDLPIPKIDRQTASKIYVKVYIPLTISVQSGTTIMYLNIERCTGKGVYGLDVMGTGHSFIPTYGNKPTLALNIGHSMAQLTEGTQEINCTLSARVRNGKTIYTQSEKQDFTVTVETYNKPLGAIDNATDAEILTVKKHLNDLDKKIGKRETIDKYLGKFCSLAKTIGDTNTVLQALRTVLWGVLAAVSAIFPEAEPLVTKVWKMVQTTLGGIHNFVTRNVWPPGILPSGSKMKNIQAVGEGEGGTATNIDKISIKPGNLVKWVCMLYTCKHYDVGTYLQIFSEALDKAIFTSEGSDQPVEGYSQGEGDEDTEYSDANGKTVKGVYRDRNNNMVTEDGQFLNPVTINDKEVLVITDGGGNPINGAGRFITYDDDGSTRVIGGTTSSEYMYGEPADQAWSPTTRTVVAGTHTEVQGTPPEFPPTESGYLEYQQWAKDHTVTVTDYKEVTIPGMTYEQKTEIRAQNEMLINALNGHQWRVDPYRSVHFDDLCLPAQLYNFKKDKQISCMYLRCLQDQSSVAVPKAMCDGNYKVNKCLYLDSAEYVLSGGNGWKIFFRSMGDAFENSALGLTISILYKKACRDDYIIGGFKNGMNFWTKGLPSALCGAAGVYFASRELIDAYENYFAKPPADNDVVTDYCEGLDYKVVTT
ncbi:MAG: hypothetical protein ACP5OA_00845 [Candidatus Woesearchaeota archaeon]